MEPQLTESDVVKKEAILGECVGEKLDHKLNFGYTQTVKLEHDLGISLDLSLLMVFRLLSGQDALLNSPSD